MAKPTQSATIDHNSKFINEKWAKKKHTRTAPHRHFFFFSFSFRTAVALVVLLWLKNLHYWHTMICEVGKKNQTKYSPRSHTVRVALVLFYIWHGGAVWWWIAKKNRRREMRKNQRWCIFFCVCVCGKLLFCCVQAVPFHHIQWQYSSKSSAQWSYTFVVILVENARGWHAA